MQAKLGAGGMGVVFAGTQEPLGRPVALKVLVEAIAHDPTAAQRFEREAQAIARLNHPNIVTVYEFGRTNDGLLFLAMELVEGRSLAARIAEGPVPWDESLEIMHGITAALAEAHAAGIVHRDLKPENIMLLTKGGVKVLDFGLARMSNADPSQQITRKSIIMGTPGFIAPEQVKQETADARSDLYAVGMVWWEMLVGRAPFTAGNPIELLIKHTTEKLPSPLVARPSCGAPPRGVALIERLGAKDPRERPDDGSALLGELKSLEAQDAWQVSGTASPLAGAGDEEWSSAFDALDSAGAATPTLEQPPTESIDATQLPPSPARSTQSIASLSGPSAAAPGPSAPKAPPSAAPTVSASEIVDGDDPFAGLDAHTPPSAEAGSADTAPVERPSTYATVPTPAPTAAPPPTAEPAPRPEVHQAVQAARAGDVDSPEDFRARFFDMPAKSAAPPAPAAEVDEAQGPPVRVPDPGEPIDVGAPRRGRLPMEIVGAPVRPEVRWRVRVSGVVQGPFEFADVVDMVRRGTLGKRDDAAPEDEPFRPLTSYPLLARELQSRKGTPMTSQPRGSVASSPLRRVAFVLALGVAAGAGVLYGLAPDVVDEQLQRISTRATQAAGGTIASPLEEHLATWGKDLGQPGGTAAEYIARARALLAKETVATTLEAEKTLRRALLIARDDARAVAGLVEARVRLPAHARPQDGISLEATVGFAETLAPDDSHVARARGALALATGDTARARTALLRAQQVAPDDSELLTLLARADLSSPQRAREHARRALELAPSSTRARAVAGMAHRRLGEHDAAIEYLAARVEQEPRDPLAARELALARLAIGDHAAAVVTLRAARKAQPDAETDWLLVHLLLASPRARPEIDPILAEATKHVGRDARAGDLLAVRAERLLAAAAGQQALVVAEDAVARFPDNARAQTALARVYLSEGRLVDANKALARARAHIDHNDEALMVALAEADLKVAEGAAPTDAYPGVVGAAPHRPGPRLVYARALVAAGDREGARKVLFQTRETDPAYWLDRPGSTVWRPDFTEWAAAAKGVRPAERLLAGALAFQAGERKRAAKVLDRVLKQDAAEPTALLYRALLDLRQDEVVSAYKRLQRLDALEDDSPPVLDRYLVLAAARAGDIDLAQKRSAELPDSTRDPAARETALGVVAAARGEPKKARFHLQRALVLDPGYAPPHEELRALPRDEDE